MDRLIAEARRPGPVSRVRYQVRSHHRPVPAHRPGDGDGAIAPGAPSGGEVVVSQM